MLKYLYIILAAIVLFLVYTNYTAERISDKELIENLVSSAVIAVNSHSVSGCMKYVSDEFTADSDINKSQLRALIAQTFRSEPYFFMDADLQSLEIIDQDASGSVSVSIVGWGAGSMLYRKVVDVRFKKEKARKFRIVPTDFWRVTHIDSFAVDESDYRF